MSSNKSGRVLAAAALVAALCLAVPVAASEGPGASLGWLERLESWITAALTGSATGATDPAGADDSSTSLTTGEGDPEGCRDYTACIDPNG